MPYIRDRVIKGNNTTNVDYIVEAHEAYKYYINRWTFLGDSYQGGYDYFMGKYLEPYYYCLLYTSPSPRDGLLSRMPSSA